ncbi:helix-hairpin-helix domain-containing protein [Lentibacillus salinarum]|uniref:Helix-hairpin-helix domain-containing protein n=1 Tax=Lentibacillus salinarum TaxID=446820 RepID=A0ABW3ZXJ6_9BACI
MNHDNGVDKEVAEPADVQKEEAPDSEEDPLPDKVMVDVKGEIADPGVYEMETGSRVNDVIQLAGGFTQDADQSTVNLAQKVRDEMVVMVPKSGEASSASAVEDSGDAKVRINDATQDEIEELNGIGPSKAAAIIQYRDENGYFETPDDLLNVSGIGEKTLASFADSIQVP